MKVRVFLASIFKEALKKGEVEVELSEGSNLYDLMGKLASRTQGPFKNILTPSREVRGEVLLLLNGMRLRKTDVELRDGDVVFLTCRDEGSAQKLLSLTS